MKDAAQIPVPSNDPVDPKKDAKPAAPAKDDAKLPAEDELVRLE